MTFAVITPYEASRLTRGALQQKQNAVRQFHDLFDKMAKKHASACIEKKMSQKETIDLINKSIVNSTENGNFSTKINLDFVVSFDVPCSKYCGDYLEHQDRTAFNEKLIAVFTGGIETFFEKLGFIVESGGSSCKFGFDFNSEQLTYTFDCNYSIGTTIKWC